MFERLQKPFLTVETGEAYQPIRLTYNLRDKDKLTEIIDQLKCCEKNPHGLTWNWFWRDECNEIHFESLDTYKKNPERPLRLGALLIRDEHLFISLPSFKRACLAVPFFNKYITDEIASISKADFINKVFGTDERLPHGFSELFKDEVLDKLINTRLREYAQIQEQVENASSAEEAITLLSQYNKKENQKRLPYAERYSFESLQNQPADITFLSFYIYLRGRELVAIHRWFGETGYSLGDVVDETVQHIFGDMDIDLIE